VLDLLGKQQEHVVNVLSLYGERERERAGKAGRVPSDHACRTNSERRTETGGKRYGLCGGLIELDAVLLGQLLSLFCAHNLEEVPRRAT
jgi:hypothetical protein